MKIMYETLLTHFSSYAGISALVVLVTQMICNLFKVTGKPKQYVSWGVSVLVVAAAVLLGVYGNIGVFTGWCVSSLYDWACSIAITIGCGLVSNGLYDWELIRTVLKWLGLYKETKKLKTENEQQ